MEQDQRAAQVYTATKAGRKNIPTENLVTERYFAKFVYLTWLSASHRNKNFKNKQIQDDLMLELEVEVLKKTERKLYQGLEVVWRDKQRQR